MTVAEAEKHYEALTNEEARRFNLLVSVALKLGKPHEAAYDYARMIMEAPRQEEDTK